MKILYFPDGEIGSAIPTDITVASQATESAITFPSAVDKSEGRQEDYRNAISRMQENGRATYDGNPYSIQKASLGRNPPKPNSGNTSFSSLNSFKEYIAGSNEIELGGSEQGQEYTAWFKFNLIYIGGIIIYVRQQIEPIYEIKDVTSSEWGVTIAFSWEQTTYQKSTSGNLTTINVYGKLHYNIIIDGMGTVYSELKNFQVIVNNTTGKEVGLKIIQ